MILTLVVMVENDIYNHDTDIYNHDTDIRY